MRSRSWWRKGRRRVFCDDCSARVLAPPQQRPLQRKAGCQQPRASGVDKHPQPQRGRYRVVGQQAVQPLAQRPRRQLRRHTLLTRKFGLQHGRHLVQHTGHRIGGCHVPVQVSSNGGQHRMPKEHCCRQHLDCPLEVPNHSLSACDFESRSCSMAFRWSRRR